MYNLRITGLTTQRDTSSLVRILLKIPGLTSSRISSGLKIPPFNVLSTENEEEAQKLKTLLEKSGATCSIENTKASAKDKDGKAAGSLDEYIKHRPQRKYGWNFWFAIFAMIGILVLINSYNFSCEGKQSHPAQHKRAEKAAAQISETQENASAPELKNELKKNPYNADAWKSLADKLESQGDTVAAQHAKNSYEKAVKVQMVLASLAKAFGNKVKVEITEDAVYYRTSYDFTDDKFHAEAGKLMDSLSVKFPGKNLIIENYTSDNRIQKVQLKSKTQPKD